MSPRPGCSWPGLLRPRLRPRDVRDRASRAGVVRIGRAGLPVAAHRAGDDRPGGVGRATATRASSLALVRGGATETGPSLLRARRASRTPQRMRRALGIGAARASATCPGPALPSRDVVGYLVTLRLLAALGWLLRWRVTILHGPGFDVTLRVRWFSSRCSRSRCCAVAAASGRVAADEGPPPTSASRLRRSAQSAAGSVRERRPPRQPAWLPWRAARPRTASRWLQRLDAMAASLGQVRRLPRRRRGPDRPMGGAGGSRRAPAVRAAAARFLARVAPEEAPRRIADALAVERDRRDARSASASPSRRTSRSPRGGSSALRSRRSATARRAARRPTLAASVTRTAGSPCAASSASHAASAAAIVVKYGMFASSVCRRSE